MEAVVYGWKGWDMDASQAYSGTPTKEVEESWDRLWQCERSPDFWPWSDIIMSTDGSLGINESKLWLLNKSADTDWAHTAPELGGGVTAFFEGFHQIHCLVCSANLL